MKKNRLPLSTWYSNAKGIYWYFCRKNCINKNAVVDQFFNRGTKAHVNSDLGVKWLDEFES